MIYYATVEIELRAFLPTEELKTIVRSYFSESRVGTEVPTI